MAGEWNFVCPWASDSSSPECPEAPLPAPASAGHRDGATCIAPASPPLSIPPKKSFSVPRSLLRSPYLKRYASSSLYSYDTIPSPRKRTRTQDDQLSITTTTSTFSDIQLPPAAYSRSSSPAKVRANSPVRELRDIYRFATPPLKYTTSPDENTPQNVLDMLHGLPLHGVGVIPSTLKETIKATLPFEHIPDYAFMASSTSDEFAEQSLWRIATNTVARAKSCFIDNEPEGPWLTLANKLLEDVFAQPELKGMLCVKDVQYSDINSATLLPHVHNNAIPTKKADLAIAISTHTPATVPIYTALRTSDPTMRLSQMSETSVSRLALPGCVEVGEPGKSYLEASLQLGVWCFAGLAKLDELKVRSRMASGGTVDGRTPTSAINGQVPAIEGDSYPVEGGNSTAGFVESCQISTGLPVFGWTAIGMDWKLHIAYRDPTNGGVVILGPLDSGGLGSAMAFFKLFQTATALAKWAKETYWIEFMRIAETRLR